MMMMTMIMMIGTDIHIPQTAAAAAQSWAKNMKYVCNLDTSNKINLTLLKLW